MKMRWIIMGGILVLVVIAGLASLNWKPSNQGIIDDFADVDLEHVIVCATRSNSAYHEPAMIRKELGAHVEIEEFPKSELRVIIDSNPGGASQWVIIRGTANLANVSTDLAFVERDDNELGVRVHRGFDESLQECLPWVMERIDSRRPVCLTGHSLGGAVAALLLAVLEHRGYETVSAVTFGQPKVTDDHGADSLNRLNLLRAVYEDDPVPMVPPFSVGVGDLEAFHHFGAEVILSADGQFMYLAAHDPNRLDGSNFWSNITHLRPKAHFLTETYIPSLELAHKWAKGLAR